MEFEKMFEEMEALDQVESIPEMGRGIRPEYLDIVKSGVEFRTDVPGVDEAVVIGRPYFDALVVDPIQGDEIYGAEGTCGLTSVANVCRMAGLDVTEGMVVQLAMENDLCNVDPLRSDLTGGTTDLDQEALLEMFGIEATCYSALACGPEKLAQAIDEGRGVIVGLNAGSLWDDPAYVDTFWGLPCANHAVTLTGYARDAATGEISGFYICDSGAGEACRYLSIDEFKDAYNILTVECGAVITDEPL